MPTKVAVGKKVPNFSLESSEGETFSLSDKKGKKLFFIFIRKTVRRVVRLKVWSSMSCWRNLRNKMLKFMEFHATV